MLRIAVVGYGYWGPNLVRNFQELPEAEVVAVSDLRPERLAQVHARYPTIRTAADIQSVLDDPTVDAVVIATPVSTHFPLALQALRAGKHVLVEKPVASSSSEAQQLIEEAAKRRLTLMVDHTFVYSGAVGKIRDLLVQQRLGEILYYDSVRVNLGLVQHDVDVLWDLAVHDLSIMDFVLDQRPTAVSATGVQHVQGRPASMAYLTCHFDGYLLAHFHVNWLAPVKIRRTMIGGTKQMILYDDLEPSEKIRVYDKGVTVSSHPEDAYQLLVGYRTGDMWAPQVGLTEALHTEAAHFVECVTRGLTPRTDGEVGLRLVRILEAATKSLGEQGRVVQLS